MIGFASGRRSPAARRLGAAAAAVAALSLFVAEDARSFGTYNNALLGQSAEHERITRVLQCTNPAPVTGCLDPLTMDQLAGRAGTLGAVGEPDAVLEVARQEGDAHCDDADHLDRPGYPQQRAEADAALRACAFKVMRRLNAAVEAAGGMLDAGGALRPSQAAIHDCSFPREVTSSAAEAKSAKCQVVNQTGRALHAIEDFWSHSNWSDVAAPGAISPANPPGLGQSHVPGFLSFAASGGVSSPGQLTIPPGVITGCDDSVPVKGQIQCRHRVGHGALNKDEGRIDPATGRAEAPSTSRGKVGANFAAAVTGARDHAARTWADLLVAVRARYGPDRGARIAEALRDDHPWTRCAVGGGSSRANRPPVGAQRSVSSSTPRIENDTAAELRCRRAVLAGGEWASLPPDAIDPFEWGEFRVQSDAPRELTPEGFAVYEIGSSGYQLRVSWRNPAVGSNEHGCTFLQDGRDVTRSAPYVCRIRKESGYHAEPRFNLQPRRGVRAEAGAGAPQPAASGSEEAAPLRLRGKRQSRRPPVKVDRRSVDRCRGYATSFGLHIDDLGCRKALRRMDRSLRRDRLCPSGWRTRRRARIEDFNERGDGRPSSVLCKRRSGGHDGDGPDRYIYYFPG